MRKLFIDVLCAGMISLGLVSTSGATLINRGGGLIYDSGQDITWVQDANLGAGSVFDDGEPGDGAHTIDGKMTWASAVAWADSLVIGGFDDWRLPICLDGHPQSTSCNVCLMNHLFQIDGISVASPGPFINIQFENYWTGTETSANSDIAWDFFFGTGVRGNGGKSNRHSAWAVRDGDVLLVPEPNAILLMGLAFAGLGFANRRRLNA